MASQPSVLALAPGQLLVKGPAAAAEAALLLVELPRASDDGGGVVDTEESHRVVELPLPLAPLAVTAQWPIALALMADRLQLIALPSGELLHALTYPPFLQDGLDAIGDHARRFTAGDVSTKAPPPLVVTTSACGSNALLAVGESVCRVPLMPAASLLAHADKLRELSLGGVAVGGEAEAAARRRRLREFARSLLEPAAANPVAALLHHLLPRAQAEVDAAAASAAEWARVGERLSADGGDGSEAVARTRQAVAAATAATHALVRTVAHSLSHLLAPALRPAAAEAEAWAADVGAQQAAEAELLSIVHSEVEAAAFGALGGRLLALFETQQRCGGSAALWAARLADTADTILSGEILLDALGVDAALRDERSEVDGLKLAGNQAFAMGDLPRALELFSAAIAREPTAVLHSNRAGVYLALGRADKALATQRRDRGAADVGEGARARRRRSVRSAATLRRWRRRRRRSPAAPRRRWRGR